MAFWWEDAGRCDTIEDSASDGGFDGMQANYSLQRWKSEVRFQRGGKCTNK